MQWHATATVGGRGSVPLAAASASSLLRSAKGSTVLDRNVLVNAKMEGNTLETGIMTAALMKPAMKVWPVLPGSVP